MKCQFYLTPNLDITKRVSDDLKTIGIDDWYIHVLSKDNAGIKRHRLRSSNYIERSDALAGALTGGIAGLIVGVLAALLLSATQFADGLSGFVYVLVVAAPACFGFWEGALLRSKYDGRKTALFNDDIEAGKHLLLVYAPAGSGEAIKAMIHDKHPKVEYVAVDENFMNPFKRPERRQLGA